MMFVDFVDDDWLILIGLDVLFVLIVGSVKFDVIISNLFLILLFWMVFEFMIMYY